MHTSILDARSDLQGSVRAAIEVLRANSLTALPTETVYGLAGDALAPEAVARIFEAKARPYFDPLIVHIGDERWLRRLTRPDPREERLLAKITERFWPGPLTILLPGTGLVPDLVTAGSRYVAVRMPRHPVFSEVLRQFGKPLAAPSANRFGRVSPTRAEHVLEELEGKIPLILDFGPTPVGLESTIVRLTADQIEILRPGPITEEALAEFAPVSESVGSPASMVPGRMTSHYAPGKPVFPFDRNDPTDYSRDSALICWGPVRERNRFLQVRSLSENYDLLQGAQRLFQLLRELDQEGMVRRIFVESVPETGLGRAIMNRVRRAMARKSDSPPDT